LCERQPSHGVVINADEVYDPVVLTRIIEVAYAVRFVCVVLDMVPV